MHQKIGRINLIRIVACVLILLLHANSFFGLSTKSEFVNIYIKLGATGCSIFFIVSGFLLQIKYRDEPFFSAPNRYIYFIKHRYLKILPVSYLSIFLTYIVYNLGGEKITLGSKIPLYILGLQQLTVIAGQGMELWFISAICILYLVFPLLSYIAKNSRVSYKMVLIVAVISEYIYWIVSREADFAIYYFDVIYRIPEFFSGIIAAELYRKREKRNSIICEVLVLFCLIAGYYYLFGFLGTEVNLYIILIIPTMSYLLVHSKKEDIINSIGNCKVCLYLSEISMGIYIWQSVTIPITKYFVVDNQGIIFIMLTVFASILSNGLIERPLSNTIKNNLFNLDF